MCIYVYMFISIYQEEISYFGLARNLIRPIISPNQDDLSYSSQMTFRVAQTGAKPSNTLFGWTIPFSADVSLAVLQ